MRKSLIALAFAGFAVASSGVAAPTPAHAKGKGFGVGLGVGLIVGGIIASQHHHHQQQRRVVTQPQPYYPAANRPQAPAAPVVRTADDQGRFYDGASKTWFDGRGQCFTGTAAWTFRAGSWFYGTTAWRETNGLWQASTGKAPTEVDCASVPTIAARLPKQALDKTTVIVSPSSEDHAMALAPAEPASGATAN